MANHIENERIAKLEVLVEHMAEKQDNMAIKVETMHNILLQVKGAKWIGLVLAGLIGSVLAKADVVLHYILQGGPRP